MSINYTRLFIRGLAVILPVIAVAVSPQDNADLAQKTKAILNARCFDCHGLNGQASKGIFVLDRARLVSQKTVLPGDANSLLLKEVESGAMPSGRDKLPANEIETLRKWVAAGAPDWDAMKPEAPFKFLTEAEILRLITADIERSGVRDRLYLRYYSIAHLYNAGLEEEELEGYRIGLSKLLNSLSWNPEITRPTPIDPAKTILRIDLRDFDWTPATWKTIQSAYPYGVVTSASARITTLSGATLPYVRADWFVANASIPPLYHDILGLPDTVLELERKLGVDVQRNLDQERNVVRGGVRKSGVSKNNRIVERHVSGYGAYWKSYDFANSVGEQNIFRDPVHPNAAGGEIIFNLPNGMQGYLLVDAKGKRLDKGPIEIVTDTSYPDAPTVVNGRSCMSCHYAGTKAFRDDVRLVIQAQTSSTFDRDKALALYPGQEELERLLKRDGDRFRIAVEKSGGKIGADFRTEPVNALGRRFDGELSVALAAAEAGMEPKAFQTAIGKSNRLSELGFGQLLVENGGMKRDAWGDYFGDLAKELRLGEYQNSTLIEAAPRPVVPDRTAPANPGLPAGGRNERINPKDGAVMVYIPPGEFLMGDADQDDNPRQKVTLSGYWIYKSLVTVKQYKQFCAANSKQMPVSPMFNAGWTKEDHPIVNVSWNDAVEYCQWAGVSLPSEAQWERAARGTDGRKYPWGSEFDASKLWCSKVNVGDAGGTAPVGKYVHLFGLSDMAGNVWQWCADTYDADFWKGRASETPNPVNGAPLEFRVRRGGSWDGDNPSGFRVAYRGRGYPTFRNFYNGFRCSAGP